MGTSQLMESFQVLLLQTKERCQQRLLLLETQERQKALFLNSEEQKDEKWKILNKNMIQKQKQLQKHTTAQLGLLHNDLNRQEVRLCTVEKPVSNVQQTMSTKRSVVED